MKRIDMIKQLVKIYDTRPAECSSYHIIDVLLGAAERRGMLPPGRSTGQHVSFFDGSEEEEFKFEWEDEDDPCEQL